MDDNTTKIIVVAIIAIAAVAIIWFLRTRFSKGSFDPKTGKVTITADEPEAIANLRKADLGKKSDVEVDGSGARLEGQGLKTGEEVKIRVKKT